MPLPRAACLLPALLVVPTVPAPAQDAPPPAAEFTLREPLDRDWAPAWVSFPIQPAPGRLRPDAARVVDAAGAPADAAIRVAASHADGSVREATAYVFTPLKARETRTFRVVAGPPAAPAPLVRATPGTDGRVVFSTDILEVRAAAGSRTFDPPVDPASVPPPLDGIRRAGGAWLGAGRLAPGPRVAAFDTETDVSLPHVLRHRIRYRFEDGSEYAVRLTVTAREPAVHVEEEFPKAGAGGFIWDFRPGLEPTHGAGMGRIHPPGGAGKGDGYPLDHSQPWLCKLQPFFAWWNDYSLYWAAFRPGGELVAISTSEPPKWTDPPANVIRLQTGSGPKVEAEFPLRRGSRAWLLLVARADDVFARSPGGANLIQRTQIRLVQNPLDRVKDFVLDWPGAGDARHPHLLCRPEDVPAIRRRAATEPFLKRVLDASPEQPGDDPGLYLATGDEAVGRRAADSALAQLRRWVDIILDGANYQTGVMDIGFARPLRGLAMGWDLVADSPRVTPEERAWARHALAFIAYCLYDENRWPARHQGFHRGNVNFHSDDYTARAAVVALLPGHPLQKEWMAYVEREMAYEFATSVYPGGAWCEAPNYQGYTMHYIMIAMRLMQVNGFGAAAKDPRFRATMDYFFRIQTPRDPRCGRHLLPTVGDTTSYCHSQTLQCVYAWAAALAPDDPAFASRMMFAFRRGGEPLFGAHSRGFGSGWTQPLLLVDPAIPAAPPAAPPASERLPGYGAIFRNHWGTDRESYFLFKMGQVDQHFDADEGAFHWYALGAPLSLDFGCMYKPSVEQPWLHSTLDFNRCRTWSRGEVTQFASLPAVDFCAGEVSVNDIQPVVDDPLKPPPGWKYIEIERGKRFIDWRRDAMFVRGPDYVILRDTLDDIEDRFTTGWSLQVFADGAKLDGPRARFAGKHGVDLDVLVAEPADAKLSTTTWGFEGEPEAAWASPNPMPAMSEEQIALHVSQPPDGDFLAAMVPYRRGAPPPAMKAEGPGVVRVVHEGGDDLVFLGPARGLYQAGGVTFAGRAGLIRRTKDAVAVHILDGNAAQVPEMIVQFPGPVTLEIAKGRLAGATDGPTRTCFLHWVDAPPLPAKLTLDGQEVPVYATFDGYVSFTVPDGAHRFEVRYPKSGE